MHSNSLVLLSILFLSFFKFLKYLKFKGEKRHKFKFSSIDRQTTNFGTKCPWYWSFRSHMGYCHYFPFCCCFLMFKDYDITVFMSQRDPIIPLGPKFIYWIACGFQNLDSVHFLFSGSGHTLN